MTKRTDIIDGFSALDKKYGLIYTERCGWVDIGHANPAGASELWNKIRLERHEGDNKKEDYFRITYSQMMGKPWFKVGIRKQFYIKNKLTLEQKKSVALSIFLDVSKDFERLQGNWLFSKFTNSSFSAEDLVSNLIGFYRAVEPNQPYLDICKPVSKEIALQIWDTYGPVGENKNTTTIPYLYPLPSQGGQKQIRSLSRPSVLQGPVSALLPAELNTIKPAKQGIWFTEAD